MATFTATIQELINDGFDFGLTDQDYPIYREQLRGVCDENGRWQYVKVDNGDGGQEFFGLNRMILDHYMYWEIGQETPDMFRFILNRRMREIMPYYNQLLMSETLDFDPFRTQDSVHTSQSQEKMEDESRTTNDTTGSTDTKTKSRSVSSQMPQTMLAGNEDYASAASDTNGTSNASTTSAGAGESSRNVETGGNVTTHISGSSGHTAALLMQYRRSFLNIAMMIVNELEPLFMMVTDNLDDNFERRSDLYGPHGFGFPYFQPTI